jgi:hypothetical protein
MAGMSRRRRPGLSPDDALRVDIYRAVQSQATAVAEGRTPLPDATAEVRRVAGGREDLLRELLGGLDPADFGYPPVGMWQQVIEGALEAT